MIRLNDIIIKWNSGAKIISSFDDMKNNYLNMKGKGRTNTCAAAKLIAQKENIPHEQVILAPELFKHVIKILQNIEFNLGMSQLT